MTLDELVAGYRDIHTSTIANALDDIGFAGVIVGLRAVVPGTKAVGPAVTVRERTASYGTFPASDFRVGDMIDAASPGDVLVVENGGAPVSTWGGMASIAGRAAGLGGLVVDGGVRDWEEQQEVRFPIFSRHVVPTPGKTRIRVEAIGEPIVIERVPIHPGDLIVADGSGICVIPIARAAEVLEMARRFAADDAVAAKELESGLTLREALGKFPKI